jgi:cytochrome c oxidase subunit 4
MSTHTEHAHEHHEHHESAGVYVKTLLALLVLTVITVGASYIDFGSGNVVIALFIATIKATLVALFFMHLRYEKPVNGIIATAGFLFLGIFLMFCFMDQDTRRDPNPRILPPVSNAPAPGTTTMPMVNTQAGPEQGKDAPAPTIPKADQK